jgi:hypothetical protein
VSWKFPAATSIQSKALHRVFDPRRIIADDPSKLKGTCAEFLGLFALLRHWIAVEAPVDPALVVPMRSFLALCGIIDLILKVKRELTPATEAGRKLTVDCSEYLRLHKVLWAGHMRKHRPQTTVDPCSLRRLAAHVASN